MIRDKRQFWIIIYKQKIQIPLKKKQIYIYKIHNINNYEKIYEGPFQ